jgi:ABC-type branched-subunit amino acid transport system ATPase component
MENQYSPEVIREIMKLYVDPYIPLVDEVLNGISPALDKIFGRLAQYLREQNIKSIKYYESEGLSHSDSILLTINGNIALTEMVKNMGNNKVK